MIIVGLLFWAVSPSWVDKLQIVGDSPLDFDGEHGLSGPGFYSGALITGQSSSRSGKPRCW